MKYCCRYIISDFSDATCPHTGLTWKYNSNGFQTEPSLKVDCNKSKIFFNVPCVNCSLGCAGDPPSAPAGSSSDWDNSSKSVGTSVTYTCRDVGLKTRATCDPATLAWLPSTIPAC